MYIHLGFNSTMVRLKGVKRKPQRGVLVLFQFHNGSIKRFISP